MAMIGKEGSTTEFLALANHRIAWSSIRKCKLIFFHCEPRKTHFHFDGMKVYCAVDAGEEQACGTRTLARISTELVEVDKQERERAQAAAEAEAETSAVVVAIAKARAKAMEEIGDEREKAMKEIADARKKAMADIQMAIGQAREAFFAKPEAVSIKDATKEESVCFAGQAKVPNDEPVEGQESTRSSTIASEGDEDASDETGWDLAG
ncbi:hypothetical protein HKX48_002192 [Thoreauomyces humboldtii]|nr:hypothetical protein HKX48_002192 [Thoreauomyces humboldtii]